MKESVERNIKGKSAEFTAEPDFRVALPAEFENIRNFYWDLIDRMDTAVIGWKKGIYPDDDYLKNSLKKGQLYVLTQEGNYLAAVILNSESNEGYRGLPWHRECREDEVLIPHAFAVSPQYQRHGIGKVVVRWLILLADVQGKKAVRLDILGTNTAAEKLYTAAGFAFVAEKEMFYEDTGWTKYKMFDLEL